MPTLVSTFYSRLRDPLARNDTTGDAFILQGLNFASTLIALMFDPPELSTVGSLTVTTSASSVSLSTLTRLRTIKHIYNYTASKQIFYIPFSRWYFSIPSETGNVRFWSRDSDTLYVAPGPSASNTLYCYYNTFPAVLTSSGDSIAFDNYDPLVESYALVYALGCMEEIEVAGFWDKLASTLDVPTNILYQTRQLLEGGPRRGNDQSGTKT